MMHEALEKNVPRSKGFMVCEPPKMTNLNPPKNHMLWHILILLGQEMAFFWSKIVFSPNKKSLTFRVAILNSKENQIDLKTYHISLSFSSWTSAL